MMTRPLVCLLGALAVLSVMVAPTHTHAGAEKSRPQPATRASEAFWDVFMDEAIDGKIHHVLEVRGGWDSVKEIPWVRAGAGTKGRTILHTDWYDFGPSAGPSAEPSPTAGPDAPPPLSSVMDDLDPANQVFRP